MELGSLGGALRACRCGGMELGSSGGVASKRGMELGSFGGVLRACWCGGMALGSSGTREVRYRRVGVEEWSSGGAI